MRWLRGKREKPKKSFYRSRLVTYYNPQALASERFQSLYLNIMAVLKEKNINKVLVSSCRYNEGKSTVASNLAYLMAQHHHKTIIIDGNFKNPTIHYIYGINNDLGLTDYLIEQDRDLEDIIVWSPTYNLSIIPMGNTKESKDKIYSHTKLLQLIEELETKYDYIIIDGAAFDSGAELLVWVGHIKDILLVVKDKIDEKYFKRRLIPKLRTLNARIIGYVENYKNSIDF